ncbi:MAG: DNA primase [Candidatus Magasanikbacteria bacterium]|nr:DNA primase [Candidatus Magasanikbacteria bacterium]
MADTNTQLIKDKIDVGDLVGEYVKLKPAGTNLKGLCPFHSEKTGSFMVSREKQIWHCFGCSKGGDIFTFIQEIEGMDFVEALRLLANRAGVEMETYKSEIDKSQKNRLFEINIQALRFFYNFLEKMPTAKPARDYLKNRGLIQETIDEWRIGFAPDQWSLLTNYLLKKGFSIDDLVFSGLTIKKDGANSMSGRGFYDRFRGRIMFPIWDINNNVVGFTGRVLVETEKSGGKYVNTPQSPVYDKSAVVFGLNKAKQIIRKQKKVLVVEGQMDVIACWQADMRYVVASSGTALTERQIKLLKRYAPEMIMSFDADNAGQIAAKRGVDIARTQEMSVKVVMLQEEFGKDPDEAIKKDKEKWFELVDGAKDVMDWNFERIFKGKDVNNPKDKQKIAEDLLLEISFIPKEIEKDHWMQKLSSELGVDISVLRDEAKRLFSLQKKRFRKVEDKQKEEEETEIKKNRLDLLIEEVLLLLFKFPKTAELVFKNLEEKYFSGSEYKKLYELLKKEYTKSCDFDFTKIQDYFVFKDAEILTKILILEGKGSKEIYNFNKDKAEVDIIFAIKEIKEDWKKEQLQKLQILLDRAQNKGDNQKTSELLLELNKMLKKN